MKAYTIALFFAGLSLVLKVSAQDNCGCDKLLALDITSKTFDSRAQLHFLNIIDQTNYSESSVQGALSGKAIIKMVPVGLNVDIRTFNQSRSELFKQEEFASSKEESMQYLRQTLRDDQLSAFNNCMQICKGTPGVYISLESSKSDVVVVKIVFNDLPGGGNVVADLKFITDGTFELYDSHSPLPRRLQSGSSTLVTLKRKSKDAGLAAFSYKLGQANSTVSCRVPGFVELPKLKLVQFGEAEGPDGELIQHPERVVECIASGDSDVAAGMVLYPEFSGAYQPNGKPVGIRFGQWQNPECGRGANGWHILGIGSCSKGSGNGLKGCQMVKAYVPDPGK